MSENERYETRRLILRRFVSEDLDAIYKLRSNADFMKHLSQAESPEEVSSWIEYVSKFWQYKAGFWAVVLKETEETIGWCHSWTLLEFPMGEMEICYAISPEYAGKGLATEAARVALDYAFNVRKAEKVNAVAMPTNYGSHRIMEKLGMHRSGQMFFPSYNMEMIYYSISLEEYSKLK